MSTRKRLDEVERTLDRVYTALLVRDPGTPLSAEAYEGLRKQVIAGAQERIAHLAQLSEFDVALRRGASVETLQRLSEQWLRQAGVAIVDDPSQADLFETTARPGEEVVVELPAYIDVVNQRVVRQGRLRSSAQRRPPTPVPDESNNLKRPTQSPCPGAES